MLRPNTSFESSPLALSIYAAFVSLYSVSSLLVEDFQWVVNKRIFVMSLFR